MTRRKDKTDHDKFEDSLVSHPEDNNLQGNAQDSQAARDNEGTTAAEEEMQSGSGEPSYVKIGDVKFGDELVVVGDEFDCIHDGDTKEVRQNSSGRLYVDCEEGKHFLDRATDLHDYVLGLVVKPAKAV